MEPSHLPRDDFEDVDNSPVLEKPLNCLWKKNKKRYCLLISYNGKNYKGMQSMPDVRTIEGELITALRKAKLISPTDSHNLYFQRASRTDKGVSALRNAVSLQITSNILTNIEHVNSLLPSDIRLICAQKVSRSFNCHKLCDNRSYLYYIPSFALFPNLYTWRDDVTGVDDVIDSKTAEFNQLLQQYVGTHNFHNFTCKSAMTMETNKRYIMSIEICPSLNIPSDGTKRIQFIPVRLVGQSFMLYQIRKMIGVAIAICRGFVDNDYISKLFQQQKLFCPTAPSYGLLLESVNYSWYNKKRGKEDLQQLRWMEYNGKILDFLNENILPDLAANECTHSIMADWLRRLEDNGLKQVEEF